MPDTVQRNILFFRSDAGTDDSGRPRPVDLRPLLAALERLPWNTGQRYMPQGDGNDVTSWVESDSRWPRLKLATLRRTDWPMVERHGTLHELPLQTDDGLCEATHIVFFPRNIVGIEFNFYGPRPSRAAWYLQQVAAELDMELPQFAITPLLRQDTSEQLNHLHELRVFDLAIRPSYAEAVAQADQDLGSAFRAAARAGNPDLVNVILRPGPRQRSWLDRTLLDTTRRLAGRSDLRENATHFTVKGLNGETDKLEDVDVLRDHFISRKQIMKLNNRFRVVDDSSAYAAVDEAYAELRDELEKAPSVMNLGYE